MKQYESYKEIHSQYNELAQTKAAVLKHTKSIKDIFSGAETVVFVASGSSYWASLSAAKTMFTRGKKPAFAVKSGDVVLSPEEFCGLYRQPIFVCPSRSGATEELMDAISLLKQAYPGANVVSVTVYEKSELESISDLNINIPFANEISVCQTRSFSCLFLATSLMAAIVGGDSIFAGNVDKYLDTLPSLLSQYIGIIKGLADPKKYTGIVTLGTGAQYGVCVEGAYIVTEVAEYPANFFQLLEYRHGPIVTCNQHTAVFICSCKTARDHETKLAAEIKKAGGSVFSVSEQDELFADFTFVMGEGFEKELISLFYVNVMQSFAHFFSIARGKNPDAPGELVPFILYRENTK